MKNSTAILSPLLESMLIWRIPIVPVLQATLHLLSTIDASASMSHYTEISLSAPRAGVGDRPARLKQGLLSSSYSDVGFVRDGMCMFTRAVWMCSCACEQVHVVSVAVWTGHGECGWSAVCFLPSFFCTSPPSSALHFLPFFQHSLVK